MIFLILINFCYFREIELFGDTNLGYYYIEAYIGNPPQKQSLIFDTGSHQIIFPCQNCIKCNKKHQFKLFDFEKSSTFQKLLPQKDYFNWNCEKSTQFQNCLFQQSYSEGSFYKGFLVIDDFRFPTELEKKQNFKIIFGCATKETNLLFDQKANGIIGFGAIDHSKNYPPSILHSLEENQKKFIFSICIAHKGGKINIGSWNSDLHLKNEKIKFIKNFGKNWEKYYTVQIFQIFLENQQILENPLEAIIDSGSTITYLKTNIFNNIIRDFNNFCSKNQKNCFEHNFYKPCFYVKNIKNFFNSFPKFRFQFSQEKIEFEWIPENYFYYDKNRDQFCIGLKPFSQNILGSTFIRNYDFLFDLTDQNQSIGFVKSNCGDNPDYITAKFN